MYANISSSSSHEKSFESKLDKSSVSSDDKLSSSLLPVLEVLDEQESEARASDIRSVQLNYKEARKEIDFLLDNLSALVEGTVNTQYHGSLKR